MYDVNLKIRFIYVRFLVILFSFLFVYSFLHWLLIIRLGVIAINENIVLWFLPMILPIIPLWIWLRKRIMLLNLQPEKDNLYFNYLFMAHVVVATTVIAFQYYVISATGGLTALKTPEEIGQHKPVKYYTIEQYYVDKQQARLQEFSYTTGKRNHTLHFALVIAVPLYANSKDSLLEPKAWLGLRYETSLDNSSTKAKKDSVWNAFYDERVASFNSVKLDGFTYLNRPGNTREREWYIETVKGLNYTGPELTHVLEPQYRSFEDRNGNSLLWALVVLGAGGLIWLFMIGYKEFDEDELLRFLDERGMQEESAAFRGIFN